MLYPETIVHDVVAMGIAQRAVEHQQRRPKEKVEGNRTPAGSLQRSDGKTVGHIAGRCLALHPEPKGNAKESVVSMAWMKWSDLKKCLLAL